MNPDLGSALIGVVVGAVFACILVKVIDHLRMQDVERAADQLKDAAAHEIRKAELEAKERALQQKTEVEKELSKSRDELRERRRRDELALRRSLHPPGTAKERSVTAPRFGDGRRCDPPRREVLASQGLRVRVGTRALARARGCDPVRRRLTWRHRDGEASRALSGARDRGK